MSDFTSYFNLYDSMQEHGLSTNEPQIVKNKKYSDAELLDELNMILAEVKTLDDYATLVEIIAEMQDQLSLHFLYLFFQALVNVELRVWGSAGMHPPMKEFMDQNLDLLLDRYEEFCLRLEKVLITWTKENGYFDNPVTYEFIKRRNSIFAQYVCTAGEIIGELN